jgi:hypothetical protein
MEERDWLCQSENPKIALLGNSDRDIDDAQAQASKAASLEALLTSPSRDIAD